MFPNRQQVMLLWRHLAGESFNSTATLVEVVENVDALGRRSLPAMESVGFICKPWKPS